MSSAPTVILGAGLSGLSVARALLRERVGGPIILVDRRTTWENDRTWCFWDTPGIYDAGLATASWTAWRTIGRDGAAEQRSELHPYLHLPADRFYEASLDELSGAPNIELMTGTTVAGVDRGPGETLTVQTSRGDIDARSVVDAMGGRGPLLRDRPAGSVELSQRFLGLEVEVEHPVFEPSAATIMDFRVPGSPGGGRFMYLLPFSRTHALLEDTSIGGPAVPAVERQSSIAAYLDELGAGEVEVLRTERGSLPMTTFEFPVGQRPGLYAAGQAAGAARPSSGYAFARTQRHATALAQALVDGSPAPSALGPRRRRALDTRFLRSLEASPQSAAEWFMTLARRTSGDVFARFMSDASSVSDEVRVMRALARPSFLAAMAKSSPIARRSSRPSEAVPATSASAD